VPNSPAVPDLPTAPLSQRRRLLEITSPAARLSSWLREARHRGIASIYWNAARIPLEEALARAGRLPPEAAVDLRDGRVLVVEPLRRRPPTA
jgi:hypothetical protein